MTTFKKVFASVGAVLFALITVTALLSCESTKVDSVKEDGDESLNVEKLNLPKLKQGKSPYYDQFVAKFEKDPNDKSIKDIFDKWGAESPDGDYYKSCFTFFYNKAVEMVDNSNAGIPDNYGYIEDSNDKNILIYRNFTVNSDRLILALSYLYKGIEKYPNRIDLWDVLLRVEAQCYFFDILKDALLGFIEISNYIDKTLDVWYADYNTMVITTEFTEPDSITREIINRSASSMIDYYPDTNSMNYYKEIYTRLEQLYPNDVHVLNELGYSLMCTGDIKGAIPYFERSYKINNGNYNAITNIIICLYITGQNEKAEKYVKKVYEIGDKGLIQAVENNLKGLGVLEN